MKMCKGSLKGLPDPIKRFLCFSGLGFTLKPDSSNLIPKLLKSCSRPALSLFYFCRYGSTHIVEIMIAYLQKGVKAGFHPTPEGDEFSRLLSYKMLKVCLSAVIILSLIFSVSSCALGSESYPQLNQLNPETPFYSWDNIDNPDWNPIELETKVTELTKAYEETNPFAPDHVCWDMSFELWRILEENGVTSFLAVRKSEIEQYGKTSEVLSHVWLIVLGQDGLALGVECTMGIVYSPSFLQPYKTACEQACQLYGEASLEYRGATNTYELANSEYTRHLEGYFYHNPDALKADYPSSSFSFVSIVAPSFFASCMRRGEGLSHSTSNSGRV